MEEQVQRSSQYIQQLRQEMHQSSTQLSARLDQMHADMNKQNAVIVGIQREFQTSMTDMTAQFTELKTLVTSFLHSSLPASTRVTINSPCSGEQGQNPGDKESQESKHLRDLTRGEPTPKEICTKQFNSLF